MKLLIVEPDASGHHFIPYLLFLMRAAIARGIEVRLLTTESALRHSAYGVLRDALPGTWQTSLMPEIAPQGSYRFAGIIQRQFAYWNSVADGFAALPADARPDHVFVLSMDGMDRAVALRGSPFGETSFSGLFVHLKFHWNALGIGPSGRFPRLQEQLLSRVLRRPDVHSMATIDASLPPWWAHRHPAFAGKLRYVPDPGHVRVVEPSADARRALGIAPDDFMVLVYGDISQKKNVGALLRAAGSCGARPVLVLAGRVNPQVSSLLQSAEAGQLRSAQRLHVFDRFIDLHTEQRLFSATDVVWLGYDRSASGQSAVLAQAASAGRPVVARNGGWIGWMTREHELGLCVDPEDGVEVASALDRLATEPDLVQQFREAGQRFAVQRSEAAFAAAILACLPS